MHASTSGGCRWVVFALEQSPSRHQLYSWRSMPRRCWLMMRRWEFKGRILFSIASLPKVQKEQFLGALLCGCTQCWCGLANLMLLRQPLPSVPLKRKQCERQCRWTWSKLDPPLLSQCFFQRNLWKPWIEVAASMCSCQTSLLQKVKRSCLFSGSDGEACMAGTIRFLTSLIQMLCS